MYRNFAELLQSRQKDGDKKRIAVVWAGERHSLEAAVAAEARYGVEPVLIGDTAAIGEILAELGAEGEYETVEAASPEDAIAKAISMAKDGMIDIIFKGNMQTATIMRAVVNKETGICKSGVLSHASLVEIPNHPKLVTVTDSALLTYPTTDQKVKLIENAVRLLRAVGEDCPKVAILAAVETVNPKMPETVEADELKEMWKNGQIADCIVEGPISYDLAMDSESATTKGYASPVAGDADILVVPNIQAGNILIKSLIFSAGAKTCGLIIGAKVPIIISSRAAPVENKCLAIAVAASLGDI